jgi:hypothetical protein
VEVKSIASVMGCPFRVKNALRPIIEMFSARHCQFGRNGLKAADRHLKNLLKSTSALEATDLTCFKRAIDRNQVVALGGSAGRTSVRSWVIDMKASQRSQRLTDKY